MVADQENSDCSSWTKSVKIGSNWKGREGEEFLDERSLRFCGGEKGSVSWTLNYLTEAPGNYIILSFPFTGKY